MRITVYLHPEVYNVLRCFGALSDVTNRILQAGADGEFSLTGLPPCPSKDGTTHYIVDVTQDDYLSLVTIYGTKSSFVSLRRILYWFVENEAYNSLGWTPAHAYHDRDKAKALRLLANAVSILERLRQIPTTNAYDDTLTHCIHSLRAMEEEL